jgi:DNA (cytosine-5)-methyltransferase 1
MYHWSQNRALTNRERARLQSFPDDFVFLGLKDSVRKQVGMAVPVKGAEAIFTALFRSFANIDYPSVEANVDVEKMLASRRSTVI